MAPAGPPPPHGPHALDAFYYPSKIAVLRVKVQGHETTASQDQAANCHEMRHFIDRAFAETLGYATARLAPPQPPCAKLTGVRTQGQRVVGMLPEPLAVTYESNSGFALDIRLDRVLVVDDMPVPLHVSEKAFDDEASKKLGKRSTKANWWPNGVSYRRTSPRATGATRTGTTTAPATSGILRR